MADVAQLVEQLISAEGVAGSIPVVRPLRRLNFRPGSRVAMRWTLQI